MTMATTMLHVQGHNPDEIERALEAIFAGEGRPRVFRVQGTYSAALDRVLSADLDAAYRYLLLRPLSASAWTPVIELGNRTEGLDRALSEQLDGCSVFSTFVYGDSVSGYRLARGGVEVDRYLSDPLYFASTGTVDGEEGSGEGPGSEAAPTGGQDVEAVRGHPERFADLLPGGTAPEDFARVVLRPGWWEEHAEPQARPAPPAVAGDEETEEFVDEVDRMRCIGLALELWGPSDYPFAQELEDIPNAEVGPAVALAFQ
jgi:hypothetical protein